MSSVKYLGKYPPSCENFLHLFSFLASQFGGVLSVQADGLQWTDIANFWLSSPQSYIVTFMFNIPQISRYDRYICNGGPGNGGPGLADLPEAGAGGGFKLQAGWPC